MRPVVSCAVGWLLLALCARTGAAQAPAEESLSGTWQAGATTVEVAVDSWGKDCGARPEPMRSVGGGSVQVEQLGKQIAIRAQGRVLHSDRCASPNPAVRRVSTGKVGNTWTTRCRTDAQDPRQEVATYTVELLSSDRMRYRDLSHFDWRLNESTCKATITTTQLLERRAALAQGAGGKAGSSIVVAPGATTTQPAASTEPACVPGKPARLSLRPGEVELQLGGRVCFDARVTDARGCAVPDADVRFALEHGPGIRAQLDGRCFRADESSAEGEGQFRVIASVSGARADAQIRVSAEQLPASLIAARVQSSALEGVPDAPGAGGAAPRTSAEGAKPAAANAGSSRLAARAKADAEPLPHRLVLLGLALVLVLAAVVFVLRREREPKAEDAARQSDSTARAPGDQPIRTRSAPNASQPEAPTVTLEPLRCPRCGARFALGSTFCGVDGERLVADP